MKQIKKQEQPTIEEQWDSANNLYTWAVEAVLNTYRMISEKSPGLALMNSMAATERLKDLSEILKKLASNYCSIRDKSKD